MPIEQKTSRLITIHTVGKSFVISLLALTLLQFLDISILRPPSPISSPQSELPPLQTLQNVALNEDARSKKDITLPGALAETLPPYQKKGTSDSFQPVTKNRTRTTGDENRFRWFVLMLALLGAPLFAVMGGLCLFLSNTPSAIFVDVVDKLTNHTLFITLPLFTFAGFVLSESKAPQRLVKVSQSLLGWFPGGTAFIVAVSCAFFTAFTGASGVTIVALGGLLYPMLMRDQYGEKFSLGILTTGGSLGLLYPPSLPVILYAVIANHSAQGMGSDGIEVKDMFLAGIIPGTLMILVIAGYGAIWGIKRNQERVAFSFKELSVSSWKALPELMIPILMGVGYFGGYVQLTEIAGGTALYVLLLECFFYKDIKLSQLPGICRRSMVMIGSILLILMMAMSLTNLLIMAKVPDQILFYMKQHITSPWTFLLILNLFLLVVGCLMDIFSAILVVVPLIVPIAIAFQINPLHLGVVFIINLAIGYSTPPVGMNLFLSSLRFQKSVVSVAYNCLPFLALLLSVLALVTYVPAISLYPVKNPWVIAAFFAVIFVFFMLLYLSTIFFGRKSENISSKV